MDSCGTGGIWIKMNKDGNWGIFFLPMYRYADIINGLVFHGRQYILPDDLQEADTQVRGIRLPEFVRHFAKGKAWKTPKHRDLIRRAAFGMHYVIIGIENQEHIDYSLPLRNMVYDVAEYEKQAAIIRKLVRKNKKGLSAGEYLYGFTKDSKLSPVTTLVLYAGKEKWTGPTSLHEMLELADIPEELVEMIPDYKINVINLREIEDTDIFKTDLKHVVDFLKCTSDPEAMEELVAGDPYYQCVEEDAYDVMASYVNMEHMNIIKENFEEGGKVNMCEGIKGWIEKEYEKGRSLGHMEGRAEGHAEGYNTGWALGIIQTARIYNASDEEIIKQLVKTLQIDEEKAKEYLYKDFVA